MVKRLPSGEVGVTSLKARRPAGVIVWASGVRSLMCSIDGETPAGEWRSAWRAYSAATICSARVRSTETSCETPRSIIVTP